MSEPAKVRKPIFFTKSRPHQVKTKVLPRKAKHVPDYEEDYEKEIIILDGFEEWINFYWGEEDD
jgi:hypothetical protein